MNKVLIQFIIVLIYLFSGSIQASEDPDFLKVAYVNNFTQFIEWPVNSPSENFRIGVIGTKEIYQAFISLSKDSKIKSRKISIDYIDGLPTNNYQIVFISNNKDTLLKPVIQKLKKHPTLIISDQPNAAKVGAHINFFKTKDHYLKFEVNVSSFKKSNIEISSRLLKLAKIVVELNEEQIK